MAAPAYKVKSSAIGCFMCIPSQLVLAYVSTFRILANALRLNKAIFSAINMHGNWSKLHSLAERDRVPLYQQENLKWQLDQTTPQVQRNVATFLDPKIAQGPA